MLWSCSDVVVKQHTHFLYVLLCFVHALWSFLGRSFVGLLIFAQDELLLFYFFESTQLAHQLHQERTQIVCLFVCFLYDLLLGREGVPGDLFWFLVFGLVYRHTATAEIHTGGAQ